VHVALAWRRGHETPAIASFRRVTQEVVASLDYADGRTFQRQVVDASDRIGKAIAK
jgi:hypothetical protein